MFFGVPPHIYFQKGFFCEKYQASSSNISDLGGLSILSKYNMELMFLLEGRNVNSFLAARDYFTTLEKISHSHVPQAFHSGSLPYLRAWTNWAVRFPFNAVLACFQLYSSTGVRQFISPTPFK